jgi:hypothetical protein
VELMELAEAKLGGGPEAHLELLFALDEVMKQLRASGTRDEDLTRELYPWIRFLVAHEADMVDMTETVFRTLAEDVDDEIRPGRRGRTRQPGGRAGHRNCGGQQRQ